MNDSVWRIPALLYLPENRWHLESSVSPVQLSQYSQNTREGRASEESRNETHKQKALAYSNARAF